MAGSVFQPYVSEAGVHFAGVYKCDIDGKVINTALNMNIGDRFHANDLVCPITNQHDTTTAVAEHRVLNASYSKLAAAIALKIKDIYVRPGAKVLYIADDTCGIELSHLSDIVGPDGRVYVVGQHEIIKSVDDEFGCLDKRSNISYIDATSYNPLAYKERIGEIDVIISDVDHIYQIESLALNASTIMEEGNFIIFIKAHIAAHLSYLHNGAIVPSIAIYEPDMRNLEEHQFDILHGITLEPYMESYGCIVGSYPS
ncbi:mediator of RNA polymerase II transcription subunit 36a [Artemisia annua]|uniref:rRNA 2'-O-methyltransferase fibrillarin n=1 Tax=Artemisia annua TaxID=35608 RepID=A0A2U1Q0D8_ARTAN|nr:mediator of RNA polymerase II transcription subunit 36a [Artemisia annua]